MNSLHVSVCIPLLLMATLAFTSVPVLPDGEDGGRDAAAIRAAVGQLVRTQLESGFFPYDFNFATGAATPMMGMEGFNLVRQTGAAFVLSEYLAKFQSLPVQSSLELFLEQAVSRSLPIGKGRVQSALEWSGFYNRWQIFMRLRQPLDNLGLLYAPSGKGLLVSVDGDYELAWTGATALTLYAATSYRALTEDHRFDEAIARWRDGLLTLQVPGRGFREAPHYLTESYYVNGQAWLAFAQYSREFPNDVQIRDFLLELDDYLLEVYGNGSRPEFFHWGMMAAVVRAPQLREEKMDAFIQRLVVNYLSLKEEQAIPEGNSCAPVEGLASYVAYMNEQGRGRDPLVIRARSLASSLMKTNRKLQITRGFAESLPDGTVYEDKLLEYQGAFVRSLMEPLMQVDYTQHCLNALLRMQAASFK